MSVAFASEERPSGWFQLYSCVYLLQVGWPSTYPKEKRKTFIQDIHSLKKKALENMVMDAKIPLRKGNLIESLYLS